MSYSDVPFNQVRPSFDTDDDGIPLGEVPSTSKLSKPAYSPLSSPTTSDPPTLSQNSSVLKKGTVSMRDSNTLRKFLFKNWKPAILSLGKDIALVYKDEKSDKTKFEYPLSQSYVTYPFFGTQDERLTTFFIRTAKGEEQYFKANSKDEAREWISSFKTNSRLLDAVLMKTLEFPDPAPNFEEKVLKMGWVREKTPLVNWRWRYMLLTDCNAYLYDKAPGNSSQLSSYATKYILSESKQREIMLEEFPEAEEESIKYAFVILSQKDSSFIAVETRNELRNWVNALRSMGVFAVKKINQFSFNVGLAEKEKEKEVYHFNISRSSGFRLTNSQGNEVWFYPLNQFKQYKVDRKTLTLDFGKSSPKPIELIVNDITRVSIVISLVLDSMMDPAKLKI